MTRRQLLRAGLAGAAGLTAACVSSELGPSPTRPLQETLAPGRAAMDGRIAARPSRGEGTATAGLQPLGLQRERDALLFVPSSYRPPRPVPLVLMLHGAGGDASGGLAPLLPLAEDAGLALLATASRVRTWDVLAGGYGPDVAMLDQALAATFRRCAVDPLRVAVAGFSDGASYALSVGLANGDLFRRIVAFSPGFVGPGEPVGRPEILVTHGRQDGVLPIERCSRRIVPRLRAQGYAVDYREFDGGHVVPPDLAVDAAARLAST